eukprot:GHVP01051235.1.p1 GENE.GHVP01051235.1~~GHVP01051235.1.p1  ORF type:complete len:165 (+),score=28.73 GHVP01051235.1:266-760(+)
MKGEDSQVTTNKVLVKKPSATASSSTDKAGRSAVQGDSIVDSERPQAEKSMGLQVATKKVVSKVKYKENLATFNRMRFLDTTELVRKPSATASSSTDKAGRSAVQEDYRVDSEKLETSIFRREKNKSNLRQRPLTIANFKKKMNENGVIIKEEEEEEEEEKEED